MRLAAVLLFAAAPAFGQDIFVMGEVHDNPAHHSVQAKRVADLRPAALVFEMLTPEQAKRISPGQLEDRDALANLLEWDESGWPDFGFYHSIMTAAPQARIYGAGVPREAARSVGDNGLAAVFGAGAEDYGLTQPLDEAEQAAREALQAKAHCDALPAAILPMMVDVQRLRDAALARKARTAMIETGGPVAVITGNGHARRDWGMPALLAMAAPDLDIHVLGQGEDDRPPEGSFDEIVYSPAPVRPDPCDAFR